MMWKCSRNALHRGAFTLSLLLCACFALMRTDCWAQDAAVVVSEFVFDQVPFPSCHASTVVQASDGTIVIAWFGGKYEKSEDVGIWISRKGADGWTSPVEVANGVQFRWTGATDVGGVANTSVQRYPT
ncbi:MAG: exo-alpha-sialidase, partial [Pirellula sp.]